MGWLIYTFVQIIPVLVWKIYRKKKFWFSLSLSFFFSYFWSNSFNQTLAIAFYVSFSLTRNVALWPFYFHVLVKGPVEFSRGKEIYCEDDKSNRNALYKNPEVSSVFKIYEIHHSRQRSLLLYVITGNYNTYVKIIHLYNYR